MAGAAKKFNLTELLNQRSKEAGEQQKAEQQQAAAGTEVVTSEEGVSSTADIYDLIPSKGNFYSVEDVQDLKQSIELLGVLQPLLVTDEEEDGKRRIIITPKVPASQIFAPGLPVQVTIKDQQA